MMRSSVALLRGKDNMLVYTCIYMYILWDCMYLYIYTCIYVYIRVTICIHSYVSICMCEHIHLCDYMYT